MAGTVAGPDDEIDLIAELGGYYPVKGGIDERDGCVAVRGLGAVCACWALPAVAGTALFSGGVNFVELIWMEVCPDNQCQACPLLPRSLVGQMGSWCSS